MHFPTRIINNNIIIMNFHAFVSMHVHSESDDVSKPIFDVAIIFSMTAVAAVAVLFAITMVTITVLTIACIHKRYVGANVNFTLC